MSQDDKSASRNILVTPDLELEMSGIDERGLKTPQMRLPGKTHVSAVILTANPWEKRNFDRKMAELNKLQIQRDRQHFWSQRQFLMTHAFDNDMNLRFANLKLHGMIDPSEDERDGIYPHGNMRQSQDRGKHLTNSEKHNPIMIKHSRKKPRKSHGIFAPPLQDQEKHFSFPKDKSNLNLAKGQFSKVLPDVERGSKPKSSMRNFDEKSGAKSPASFITHTQGGQVRDFTKEKLKSNSSLGKGLGNDKTNRPTNSGEKGHREDDHLRLRPSDPDEPICEKKLILTLTQTLPSEMMIKANANLNAEADEEKQRQLEECREISHRDALKDPRWRKLISALDPYEDET